MQELIRAIESIRSFPDLQSLTTYAARNGATWRKQFDGAEWKVLEAHVMDAARQLSTVARIGASRQ